MTRPRNSRVHHQLADFAQHLLARLVRRMRLAGEQQQHRPLGIVDQAREARAVAQQQRRALVGGEAAREAEGEHVRPLRIEAARHVAQLRRAQALARVLALQPLAHAREHARLDLLGGGPVALVGNPLERAPELQDRAAARATRARVRDRRNPSSVWCRKVGTCTPLVTKPTGLSSGRTSGQWSAHRRADTAPWMRLTPFTWRVPLSARRVMLNSPGADAERAQIEQALDRDAAARE